MPTAVLAEARCIQCNRLLGRAVIAARFDCPRCKAVTVIEGGVSVLAPLALEAPKVKVRRGEVIRDADGRIISTITRETEE